MNYKQVLKRMEHSSAESSRSKINFIIFGVLVVVLVSIIGHFIAMYRGWGLHVESWTWLFFLCILFGMTSSLKDYLNKLVEKF